MKMPKTRRGQMAMLDMMLGAAALSPVVMALGGSNVCHIPKVTGPPVVNAQDLERIRKAQEKRARKNACRGGYSKQFIKDMDADAKEQEMQKKYEHLVNKAWDWLGIPKGRIAQQKCGCAHDTDGDGNCPIHPNGCPPPH